jgi:methyl-accepting chemotaxis protein
MLNALAHGSIGADRVTGLAAVSELWTLPEKSFWSTAGTFTWSGVAVALAYQGWTGGGWTTFLQISALIWTVGWVAAVSTHVWLVPACRRGVTLLMKLGLSEAEIVAVTPPGKATLRHRLMLFVAIGTLAPSLLIAQLHLARTDQMIRAAAKGQAAMAVLSDGGPGLALSLVFIAWVIILALQGGAQLAGPMRQIAANAERIAEGDLRPQALVLAETEIWGTSTAFVTMRRQLTEALAELQGAGLRIAGATESLVKTSEQQGSGTQAQVDSLNQTSLTTEQLARSAIEIASRAAAVADIAKKTLAVARAGHSTAEAFFGSMAQMKRDNHEIADAVVKLNKRVQQIGKIVEFINEIADKADLLALNAELEGTKAGEVGRGFSLVAAEMRRLAESVMSSTREIGSLINDIRDATHAAVMATEAGVKATDTGTSISLQVSQSLKTIVDLAQATADAVQTISLATQQQQTGTGQLAEAMSVVLSITQQGAAATQQMASANSDLFVLARELKDAVDRFQTH